MVIRPAAVYPSPQFQIGPGVKPHRQRGMTTYLRQTIMAPAATTKDPNCETAGDEATAMHTDREHMLGVRWCLCKALEAVPESRRTWEDEIS